MPTREEIQEALDSASGSVNLDVYAGQSIVISGYRLKEGSYGPYAEIDATTLDGEEVTIASGGMVVLPQLKKLEEIGAFPCEVLVETFPGQFGKLGYKFTVS